METEKNTFSYTYTDVLHECRRYVYHDSDAEALTINICETVDSFSESALSTIVRETLQARGDAVPAWDYLPDIMLKVWPENPRGIPANEIAEILKHDEEFEAAAKAFEALHPSQNLFVKLRTVNGLSIQEMSDNFHMVPNEVAISLEKARNAFWCDFVTALWHLYQGKTLGHARSRLGSDSYEGDSFEDASGKMSVKLIEIVRRTRPLNFGAWLIKGVKWEADEIKEKSVRHVRIGSKFGDPEIVETDPESDDSPIDIAHVLSGPSKMEEPLDQLIAQETLAEKRQAIEKEMDLQHGCLKAFLEKLTDLKKSAELLFVFVRYYLNNSPVVTDFDKGLIPESEDPLPLDIAEGLAIDDLAVRKQARAGYAFKPLSQASIAATMGISEKTIQRRYEELREHLEHCCQQFGIQISQFDALGKYQQRI